jgi:hypothetical protein
MSRPLGGVRACRKKAERRFARKIAIEADSGYDRERFQIISM